MTTIIGSPDALPCSRRVADPSTRLGAERAWRPLARGWLSILLVASLGSAGLSAAEPAAKDSAPLRVGVSPVFPPMIFKQQNEFAGVEADLARALGEHLGRRVVFVEVPWKDQIETLNAGKTDIIMSTMSVTPARRALVSFSQPYFLVAQIALVRREDQNHYAIGFPANPPGAVGVIKATTGDFLVQRDFPKAKRKTFSTGAEGAQALLKKKISLFISDSSLIWYLAGLHAADGLAVVPVGLSEEQLAWAMRKADDELLVSVNKFITQTAQDGRLQKVCRRWTAVGD